MKGRVSIARRWLEPVPIGQTGDPIPKNLWPKRRTHSWIVRWFAPDAAGKRVRRSENCSTKDEAERRQAELQDKFNKDEGARRIPKKITLGAFADEFCSL